MTPIATEGMPVLVHAEGYAIIYIATQRCQGFTPRGALQGELWLVLPILFAKIELRTMTCDYPIFPFGPGPR